MSRNESTNQESPGHVRNGSTSGAASADSHPLLGRWVTWRAGAMLLLAAALVNPGCTNAEYEFNPEKPARGPSQLLPKDGPISDGQFAGGNDTLPAARADISVPEGEILSCDGTCRAYCDGAGLDNPINRGLCPSLWGVGRLPTAIVPEQACRRLYMDTQGRFPTYQEVTENCLGRPWGDVVSDLISTDDFIRVNRRHWADRFRYDTTSVSVERVYDMDEIVIALYKGELAYDHFAAMASAHPVLTRRYMTEGDRAEALFWLFLGRPPFGNERSDIARLYHLWQNDYYDHPALGMRLPDAFIRYRCLDEHGEIDEATAGECTSTSFGYEQLILKPDARAERRENNLILWSGHLITDEWQKLQAPGRLLSEQWLFWEHAANTVLRQYLDYDLATQAPGVGDELVRYVLGYNGDMRALHYAVLTSTAYLQSSLGEAEPEFRYMYGPLKQADAEGWVDSLNTLVGGRESACDIRLNRPHEFLEDPSPASVALIADSDWELNDDYQGVRGDYRDLVRTLGGCPDNSEGGRFKTVSVLTTANQLNYAGRLCDPGQENRGSRVATEQLLPMQASASSAVTEALAAEIVQHQTQRFFGRTASEAELARAAEHGAACAQERCDAEYFARNVCFALVGSAELLFY